jgi:hypothetical protein
MTGRSAQILRNPSGLPNHNHGLHLAVAAVARPSDGSRVKYA